MPNNIWKNLYDTAKAVINPKKISEQICSGGVGAALLTKNGHIYTGVNIDTDCSLGMCAERNAVSTMITAGEFEIAKIGVIHQEQEDFMAKFEEISTLLQRGKAKDLAALVTEELAAGTAPKDILTQGLIVGMGIVGEKFKNNEIFVPEVLIAARAMNAALAVLKPALAETGVEPVGTAVICTVKGDLHDIGKNLVKMMIEGTGIRVIDLGVDCSAEKVVQAVKDNNADIVCLSSLLTTTMLYQKDIIEALKAAGLRDKVKVMVGGAPVTQAFADEIGADAYTPDAASAAEKARSYFA